MLDDYGPWDEDAVQIVGDVRSALSGLLGGADPRTTVLINGTGTMAIESVIGSAVPRGAKLLVLVNGAFGARTKRSCQAIGLDFVEIREPEDVPIDPADVDRALAADPSIGHVISVHCETTTGLLNPIREIGLAVQRHKRRYIVDAVSSFGAYPIGPGCAIDPDAGPIDHLIASPNKCLEGVPGFAFTISRLEAIQACEGNARSYALDLFEQWRFMEERGWFRFTPPLHALRAFRQALREFAAEGGVAGRMARYQDNHRVLIEGMERMGFRPFVADPAARSHIVTAFRFPFADFDLTAIVKRLRRAGQNIFPIYFSAEPTFRLANIGSIDRSEIQALLDDFQAALDEVHPGRMNPETAKASAG
jgi:2-aminoethylphosphonate-pyruvate transaminase